MKWALIFDGFVSEVTDIDPTGRYVDEWLWVQCSEEVAYGWQYDGSKFLPPPDTTEQDNRIKHSQLMSEATQHILLLTDATDPDIMGDDINPGDIELLKQWKAYRVKLSRVTDMLNPVWPDQP